MISYKKLKYVFLAVFLVFVYATLLWAQPENMVLNNREVFTKIERPSVTFPHERHMDKFDCLTCHHRYESGKNVLDEDELEEGNAHIRCANCHNPNARLGLRHAYHRLCIGCHTKMGKAGEKTGPRMCGGCHIIK